MKTNIWIGLVLMAAGCGGASATETQVEAVSDPIVGTWAVDKVSGPTPWTLGLQFNADGSYLEAATLTLPDGTLGTFEVAGTYIDTGTVQYVPSLNPPPGGTAVIMTPTASSCPRTSPSVTVQLPSVQIGAHTATATTLALTSPGEPGDVLTRVSVLTIGTVGCSNPLPFVASPLAPL